MPPMIPSNNMATSVSGDCHSVKNTGMKQPKMAPMVSWLSARNDGDAVGDLEDLVEILADHQDCRSAAGKIDQRLADSRRGTGIDAPGRLVDDQNRRRAVKLAADDEFLQIAARQSAGFGI